MTEEKIIVGNDLLENIVNSIMLNNKAVTNKANILTPNGKEENSPSKKANGATNQRACGRTEITTYSIKKDKAMFK